MKFRRTDAPHNHRCLVRNCCGSAECLCLFDPEPDGAGGHIDVRYEADQQRDLCDSHAKFIQCDECGEWVEPEDNRRCEKHGGTP